MVQYGVLSYIYLFLIFLFLFHKTLLTKWIMRHPYHVRLMISFFFFVKNCNLFIFLSNVDILNIFNYLHMFIYTCHSWYINICQWCFSRLNYSLICHCIYAFTDFYFLIIIFILQEKSYCSWYDSIPPLERFVV